MAQFVVCALGSRNLKIGETYKNEVGYDVIIVADKKGKAEIEAATTLCNKISEGGKYSATLWNVRQYKNNEQKIDSNQKMIFVGLNEISGSLVERGLSDLWHWKCDEPGMRCGWRGNVGIVQVVPQSFGSLQWLKLKELCTYNGFRTHNEISEYNNVLDDPSTAAVDADMMDIIKVAKTMLEPTAAFDDDLVDAGIMDMIEEIEWHYLAPTLRYAMLFPIIPPANPNDKAGGKFFFGKPKIRGKVMSVQYAFLVCKLFAGIDEFLHQRKT
jgi:hypothetical protein